MMIDRELTYYPRWWKYGLPRPDLWVQYLHVFERIVEKFKLKPVGPEHLYTVAMPGVEIQSPPVVRAGKTLPIKPIPYPGGLRIPHIHFKGDVYMVNAEQWKVATTEILKDFQAKLNSAHTVGFEQMMDLTDVMREF